MSPFLCGTPLSAQLASCKASLCAALDDLTRTLLSIVLLKPKSLLLFAQGIIIHLPELQVNFWRFWRVHHLMPKSWLHNHRPQDWFRARRPSRRTYGVMSRCSLPTNTLMGMASRSFARFGSLNAPDGCWTKLRLLGESPASNRRRSNGGRHVSTCPPRHLQLHQWCWNHHLR